MASLKLIKFGNKKEKVDLSLDNSSMVEGFSMLRVDTSKPKDFVANPVPITFLVEIDYLMSRHYSGVEVKDSFFVSFDNYSADNRLFNGMRFKKARKTYILVFIDSKNEEKVYTFRGYKKAYKFRKFIRAYIKQYYEAL